jgi:hypothetical protein
VLARRETTLARVLARPTACAARTRYGLENI